MKMTMHIDDELLKRVMDFYDLETKTDAIHFALRELERRAAMKEFAGVGLGLAAEDYIDALDSASYEQKYLNRVAEDPMPYGTPRPS
jgi:Arc/MetJ family transcription regulator